MMIDLECDYSLISDKKNINLDKIWILMKTNYSAS